MPIVRFNAPEWTAEYFERSVKYAMELENADKPLKIMRSGTIILEGDIRCKIRAWDDKYCIVRYGKSRINEMTLERRFMNFKYAKEKSSAVVA